MQVTRWMNLENIMRHEGKKIQLQRSYTIGLHSHETSRIGKATETESRLAVAWKEEIRGNWALLLMTLGLHSIAGSIPQNH